MAFEGSYLWQLRQVVGDRLLLMPGAQLVVVDEQERVRQWTGALVPGADEVTQARFFEAAEAPGPLQPQTEAVWDMYAAYRATGLFQAR